MEIFRAAARLAHDRDVAGVAAEARDVVAHPFQRQHQVLHADRAGRLVGVAERIAQMQIAEQIEAMIDADHDHVVIARQVFAAIDRLAAGAIGESAAVDADHHRPRFRIGVARGVQTLRNRQSSVPPGIPFPVLMSTCGHSFP